MPSVILAVIIAWVARLSGPYGDQDPYSSKPGRAATSQSSPPGAVEASSVGWDTIPVDLREIPRWVPWRFELRDHKWTKVPLDVTNPARRGSSTDPKTWGTLDQVRAIVEAGKVSGAGLVFTDTDDFAGVDIDACRNPETGELSELAREAIHALDSYAEITPSGRGIHIWVLAPGASFERKKFPALGIELYTEDHYFTVTGDALPGRKTIEERGAKLETWWQSVEELDADQKLLKRARAAKNGEKFATLYDRGEGDYPSDSEADLGLCSLLAYWTDGDVERIDRLFRRSALMDEKWERDGYRASTIAKALERGDSSPDRSAPGKGEGGKVPVATALVELAEETHDFAASEEGPVYAVPREGPRVAKGLRGGELSFRQELRSRYFEATGRAASTSALNDAVGVLEGRAQVEERQRVHIRLAAHGTDVVVIDLGDREGRSVIVDREGWGVVIERGPLFRRTALTSAMPVPVRGGSLEPLRALLNVGDEAFDVLVGYLVAAFVPDIPHPILLLTGEQGTGKTLAMRMLASVIDPSPVGTGTAPTSLKDWVVWLAAAWVAAIDNVSRIPEWLSDALCRAATGDGLARRQLYADNDVVVNRLRNCVMLTGIAIGELRGDLGDRLLPIDLERIPEEERRRESDLRQQWEEHRAEVFGALLDLLVLTLREKPRVELESLPRMADFAEVLAAVDAVRGTASLRAYLKTRENISDQVVEGDAVAAAVRQLAERAADPLMEGEHEWSGTATEMLAELERLTPSEHLPKDWPVNAQQLSAALRRAAPALATLGVEVRPPTSNKHKRWRIRTLQEGR